MTKASTQVSVSEVYTILQTKQGQERGEANNQLGKDMSPMATSETSQQFTAEAVFSGSGFLYS